MNQEKLSKIAGVSLSTVSKAFSGSKDISESTRQKIFKIAKDSGCYEKYNKRKSDKKIVAIICPEIESAHYANMITYLEKKFSERNILTTFSISNFSAKTESELVSFYSTNKGADGIIVIGNYSKVKFNNDIPIISIGKSLNKEVDCVFSSYHETFYKAIKYFKDNGHTKIAYLGENLTKSYEKKFLDALRSLALPVNPEYIVSTKERFESAGYIGMNKLLTLKDKPTAIFTAYDYIALGAIQAIRDKGLNVPDDFSIIGSDNISFASHYNISLTTIDKNTNDACDIAIDLMTKKLENRFYKLRQSIQIQSDLIIRNSVKNLTKN